MNNQAQKSGDREATRARLVAVFNRLLLEEEAPRPRVADIIAEAGVARSTFYDHFDGVEALFDESLSMLFHSIAAALVHAGKRDDLDFFIAHIWENRRKGREMLTGPRGERAEALLARCIEDQLDGHEDKRLVSILTAGTIMAALSGWLTGRLNATPQDLSRRLVQSTNAILDAG